MITQERMLAAFKRALKNFKDDPYMEKLRVSYKLDDVEVYSKEYNRDDYENNSISFNRIYSDIEHIRKKNGLIKMRN